MSRKPVDQQQPSECRQAVWDEIRGRGESALFTMGEIAKCVRLDPSSVREYMTGLLNAGYLGTHTIRRALDAGNILFLERDTGHEAPRVRKDGTPVTQGQGQQHMWNAMRILKTFSAADLAFNSTTDDITVSTSTAASYCKALSKAGYRDGASAASTTVGKRIDTFMLSAKSATAKAYVGNDGDAAESNGNIYMAGPVYPAFGGISLGTAKADSVVGSSIQLDYVAVLKGTANDPTHGVWAAEEAAPTATTYTEVIETLITAGISASDTAQLVEALTSAAQSDTSVSDTINTPGIISETLISAATGSTSVTDLQQLVDHLTVMAQTGASISEIAAYLDQLTAAASGSATVSDAVAATVDTSAVSRVYLKTTPDQLFTIAKQPSERKIGIGIDFRRYLASGETINSGAITSNIAGVAELLRVSGSVVYALLQGGADGQTARVTFTGIGSKGSVVEGDLNVIINEV